MRDGTGSAPGRKPLADPNAHPKSVPEPRLPRSIPMRGKRRSCGHSERRVHPASSSARRGMTPTIIRRSEVPGRLEMIGAKWLLQLDGWRNLGGWEPKEVGASREGTPHQGAWQELPRSYVGQIKIPRPPLSPAHTLYYHLARPSFGLRPLGENSPIPYHRRDFLDPPAQHPSQKNAARPF